MKKSSRKFLLSITLFLSLLCFGMGLTFGTANLTQADDALQIVEVKQTFIHFYNSIDEYGMRTEYTIQFSENVFTDEDAVGAFAYATNFGSVSATISNDDVTNMLSKIKINKDAALNGSTIQNYGVAISKVANDTIKLHVGDPIGFTKFTFDAGLTVNGKALAENVVLYEETDGSFTTVEPEKKIFAVYTMPNGSGPRISIWSTKSYVDPNHYGEPNGLNLVTLNDIPLTYGGQLTVDWNNYWDDAKYLLGLNPYFKTDAFNALSDPLTIVFNKGFNISADENDALKETQTFILANKSKVTDWSVQSKFVPVEDVVSITKVEKTFMHGYNSCDSLSYRSEYNVTFDKDIFDDSTLQGGVLASTHSKIAVNTEKDYMVDLLNNMTINGTKLASISGGAAITKIANNAIKIYTGRPFGYAELAFPAGSSFGQKILLEGVTYYEGDDWTFSTSAPTDFKVFTAFERPVSADYYWINIWVNKKMTNFNNATTALPQIGFSANGQNVESPYAGSYGNDWDAGTTGYNIHYRVKKTAFDAGAPFVITFPKGWNYTTDSNFALKEEQKFALFINDHAWSKCYEWEELLNQEVTYKQGETTLDTTTAKIVELPDPTTLANYNAEKLFIGWTDGTNLYRAGDKVILTDTATYSVVELDAKTVGAELKIWGATSGVRFLTQISLAEWSAINPEFLGEYGTLVARADDLGENALTIEAADADSKVKKIVSSDCMVEEGIVEVRGGVENIPSLNYTKTLVSCAYLTINYTTGVGYVYTDVIERSIATVAQELLDSEYEFEADQIAWLNTYAGIEG